MKYVNITAWNPSKFAMNTSSFTFRPAVGRRTVEGCVIDAWVHGSTSWRGDQCNGVGHLPTSLALWRSLVPCWHQFVARCGLTALLPFATNHSETQIIFLHQVPGWVDCLHQFVTGSKSPLIWFTHHKHALKFVRPDKKKRGATVSIPLDLLKLMKAKTPQPSSVRPSLLSWQPALFPPPVPSLAWIVWTPLNPLWRWWLHTCLTCVLVQNSDGDSIVFHVRKNNTTDIIGKYEHSAFKNRHYNTETSIVNLPLVNPEKPADAWQIKLKDNQADDARMQERMWIRF